MPTTWTCTATGTGASSSSTTNSFTSVLASASLVNGDTIALGAGTYTAPSGGFSISKAVTIQGPNASVSGKGTRATEAIIVGSTGNQAIISYIDGVTITGIRVQCTNAIFGIHTDYSITVTNCIFACTSTAKGASSSAIKTTSGAVNKSHTITGNYFTGNLGGGIYTSGTFSWNTCIWIGAVSTALTISGNWLENAGCGINFSGALTGSEAIDGNTFMYMSSYMTIAKGYSGTSVFGATTPNKFYDPDVLLQGYGTNARTTSLGAKYTDLVGTVIVTLAPTGSTVPSSYVCDITNNYYTSYVNGTSDTNTLFSALSLIKLFYVEQHLVHRSSYGSTTSNITAIVKYVANNQYLNPTKFTTNNGVGGLNDASGLALALSKAASGDTINILSNFNYLNGNSIYTVVSGANNGVSASGPYTYKQLTLPTDAQITKNCNIYFTDMSGASGVATSAQNGYYVYNNNVSAAHSLSSSSVLYVAPNTISSANSLPASAVQVRDASIGSYTYSSDEYKNATATYPAVRGATWYAASTSDRALLLTAADISASIVWPSATAITYGQALSASSLSGGSAVVAGAFDFVSPSSTPSAGSPSVSIKFTPTNTTAYGGATTHSINITVNQKALTITASNDSKVYGSLKTFSTSAFESSGLVLSDSVSSVTLTSPFGAAATATVGSYGIVPSAASGSGLSNYSISYTNGSLTVSQKALTVTASNQSKVYGASPSFAGTEFSSSGLANSDSVSSVTLTCSQYHDATASANSYTIVPSAAQGSGLSNYSISYSNGSLTVSQKALTVTASNQSKVYGESKSFAGTEFSSSGLVNSDSVSSVTLTCSQYHDATASANSYTIVPSAAAGSGLSNYSISYSNGSLTVSKKALVVTASAQTAVFGTLYTLDNTLVSANALQNSDAVASATLSCTGYTDATTVLGNYTITPSNVVFSNGNASNYDITYATGQLAVGPARPEQPEIISAVHNNTTAFVSWSQPVFSGGESVLSNTLYWSSDNFATEASDNFLNNDTNTATIAGLVSSSEYKFKVSASNSAGEGPLSLPFTEVVPDNIQESTVSTFENINNGYNHNLTPQEQEVIMGQIEEVVATLMGDMPTYEELEAARAAADAADLPIELTLTAEAAAIAAISAENGDSYEPTPEEREGIIAHLENAADGSVDPELLALLNDPDTSIQSSAPAWNVNNGEQLPPYPVVLISNEPSTVTTIYMIHDISASFYWSIPSNITAGLSGEVFVVRSANNTHITTLQAHTGVKLVSASLPLIAGNWFSVTLDNDEIVTVRVPAMADFVINISLNAPTGVQTNHGGAEADVSWDIDTTLYSDPITSYVINVYLKSDGSFVKSVNTNSRSPHGSITGLTDNITYYFTVQAVNALGVGNESAPSGDYVPCFVKGTRLMTAAGYKAVETLTASDQIITADGRAVPFKLYSRVIEHCSASTAPYLIKKGAFAANSPPRDITLSPNHAIQVRKGLWQIPRYAARMFSGVKQVNVGEKVEYFHVELPNFFTDNIIAEGCIVESYGAKQVKNVTTVYKYNSNLKGFTRISAAEGIKAAKGK